MIGLDVTELRNRSRAALEVRDGQWLVAVPTGGNDEEFVKVVYAAEVGESMFMSDVKDLVVKGEWQLQPLSRAAVKSIADDMFL
jgi:hypothetical protein